MPYHLIKNLVSKMVISAVSGSAQILSQTRQALAGLSCPKAPGPARWVGVSIMFSHLFRALGIVFWAGHDTDSNY